MVPFELTAFEILIQEAFDQLDSDISVIEKKFQTIHLSVERSQPTLHSMEELRDLKTPIAAYLDRVDAFGKAIGEIMANPEDMVLMEFDKQIKILSGVMNDNGEDKPSMMAALGALTPSPDLEILLEFFDQELDQYKGRVVSLQQAIDNTERFVNLRLGFVRNKLIYIEVTAQVCAIGIGLATVLAGIFGMNLQNTWEEGTDGSHSFFLAICAACVVLVALPMAFLIFLWWRFKLKHI